LKALRQGRRARTLDSISQNLKQQN